MGARPEEDSEESREIVVRVFLERLARTLGEERAAALRPELEAFLHSAPAVPFERLSAGDLEAHLRGMEWRGEPAERRKLARVVGERFLSHVARRREAGAEERRAREHLRDLEDHLRDPPDDETGKASRASPASRGRPARASPLDLDRRPHRVGDETSFERVWIGAAGCLASGVRLLAGSYLRAVLVLAVGSFVAGAFPPLLAGPMACGSFLVVGRIHEGRSVALGDLFDGFGSFVASLGASLACLLGMMPVLLGGVVLWVIGAAVLPELRGSLEPATLLGIAAALAAVWLLWLTWTASLYTFVFPLIVFRRLGGFAAARLSVRAARAHRLQVLGLTFFGFVVFLGAGLVPVVGPYLAAPAWVATLYVAYRKVFCSVQEA